MALVLAAVLLLVTAAVSYAGWHYSEELLQVSRDDGPYDAKILGAAPGTVTLTR